MEKEQFAQRISALRKKKGYTQQELADILHVSNKTISRWETADGYPDITMLDALAKALGVRVDSLLLNQKKLAMDRQDLTSFTPFIVLLLNVLCYYIFSKLQMNGFFRLTIFAGGIYGSFYIMRSYTDQRYAHALLICTCIIGAFISAAFLSHLFITLSLNMMDDMNTNSVYVMLTSLPNTDFTLFMPGFENFRYCSIAAYLVSAAAWTFAYVKYKAEYLKKENT